MTSPVTTDSPRSGETQSGMTFRAFVAGAVLSLLMGMEITYGEKIILSTHMDMHSFSGSAVLFLLLLVVANTLLKAVHRPWAWTRPELLTIYIVLMVGSSVPRTVCYNLLPILGAPLYYATPENNWGELIQPYIRPWLVPQDMAAVKYLYEGLPAGQQIPWGAWLKPLTFWFCFLAAMYAVMICAMVILRKQWVEHERLVYPLVQLPLAMTEESATGAAGPFFRNKLAWLGFAIPFIVGCVRSFHHYFPTLIPFPALSHSILVFRNTELLHFHVSLYEVGFFYFVELSITFSIWFFYLLVFAQAGLFNILGIGSAQVGFGNYSTHPLIANQGMGAVIVLALFALWVARGHLGTAFRSAWGRGVRVDDSGELVSYRIAFLGLAAGLLYMWWALWMSGLPFLLIPLFLVGALVLYLAITRLVVEGGVNRVRGPLSVPGLVVAGVGTSHLGHVGIVALAFTFAWAADARAHVMGSMAHGLKLTDRAARRSRWFLPGIGAATALSFVGGVWVMLSFGYKLGGINLFGWQEKGSFDQISQLLQNPIGTDWEAMGFTGAGGAAMFVLLLARQHLLWWPLHPLGFLLATVDMMKWSWFSALVAWVIKAVILKYGGPRLFSRLRPFFLGLILGTFTVSGVWLVVDLFTGMIHNDIFFRHG